LGPPPGDFCPLVRQGLSESEQQGLGVFEDRRGFRDPAYPA